MEEKLESKQEIIQKLKSFLHGKVEFAYLYGSITQSHFNKESDVDIAIYLKPKLDADKVRSEIFQLFNRDTDTVILNKADTIITAQVLYNGELLLNENPKVHLLFKTQKISEYIDFKKDRKIIEDKITKRASSGT